MRDDERDPTDLGIRYAATDDEPVDLTQFLAPPLDATPATAEERARARARFGFSRTSQSDALLSRCGCGADVKTWCLGRAGYTHPSRGHADTTV